METCNWPIDDIGGTIGFYVFDRHTMWNNTGGVYIFCHHHREAPDGPLLWRAVYVGETDDFLEHVLNHPKWTEAADLGATHVHAAFISSESERRYAERKLIARLGPRLNRSQEE